MKLSTAQIRYAQVTREARMMLAGRIRELRRKGIRVKLRWREKKWPVSDFCKGGSVDYDHKALFIRPGHGRGNPKPTAYLLPWIEQLAKVIAALWLCEESKSAARLRDIMNAIRWLNEGVLGTPACGVHDLLPIHFERTVDIITSKVSDKHLAFDMICELKLLADKIDDLGLSNAKLRFFHKLDRPSPKIKVRTLDPFVRDALYHCINNPIDENERILMEVLRLHFAWGGRIEETLRLTSSLHYADRSNAVIKLPRKATVAGENYGVRYFPEKKYDKGVSIKALDTTAGKIVEDAVKRLEELCAPARERAKLLAEMPGRFPLPKQGTDQYHDPDDLVTLEDIGRWMRWKFKPTAKLLTGSPYNLEMQQLNTSDQRRKLEHWGIHPVVAPTGANNLADPSWAAGRGMHAFKYRVADFERYFLQHVDLDVLITDSRRTIAKLHELLIVVFDDQRESFAPARINMPLVPRRIKYSDIRNQLAHKYLSIFARRGMTMPDGSPIVVESHGGRHDRNKDLDEAGLTQVQQALAMGRTPSQNKNYQKASDIHVIQQSNIARLKKESQQERVRIVKDAVRQELISGTVTNAYHKLRDISPVKAEEFLDEQVGQVLVTRYGACTNEWVGQSCPKHNKCFKNCKHLHLTGSESEREELERELNIQNLHRAKVQELANQGEYRADTALEAIDAEIVGIRKAMDTWHKAAKQRQILIASASELRSIKVGVQVFESGVSHYQELKSSTVNQGRAS